MFTLAHLSDLHATSLRGAPVSAFLNKRFLGWLSWAVRRRHVYRAEVLEALLDDLKAQAPDHVALTGDLTNLALEHEFVSAARWLERLGDPTWISVVPGNHDAYVRIPRERSWDHWAEFMTSEWGERPAGIGGREPAASWADGFPTVRVRGDVALVGVCSALPTPPFRATGAVGRDQLARLGTCLRELGTRGLCRVVMIHHSPTDDGIRRRRLMDGGALRAVLERAGAELVVHGHRHLRSVTHIPGPEGVIPAVGVPAASYTGGKEGRRAQYHLYRIERSHTPSGTNPATRYRMHLVIRGYDTALGRFACEGEQAL